MSTTTDTALDARTRPPFRADHVGSLLRPRALQQARKAAGSGDMGPVELRAVENECIKAATARQESLGFRAATDGEYRRAYWHYDFISGLDGVELYEPEQKVAFKGAVLPLLLKVTGPIRWRQPVFIKDYEFVAANVTTALAKQTIPSPSVVHFRGGRRAIDVTTYPELGEFFTDLGEAYRDAVRAFAAAGCRYLQLDEVNIAY